MEQLKPRSPDGKPRPSTPIVLEAIHRRGRATLQELVDETGFSIDRIAADLGGLHDYGHVTKYGNSPQSTASWQGSETDSYVASCIDMVQRWRDEDAAL